MVLAPVSDRMARPFLAAFLPFSLLLFLGGSLYYSSEKDRIHGEKQEDLAAIADLKVSQIAEWWKERMGDGEVLRANRGLAAQAAFALRSPPGSLHRREMKEWAEVMRRTSRYRSVILLDPGGTPRLGAGEDPDRIEEATRLAALEAVRTRQVTTVDLHVGVGGHIALNVLAPLLNDPGGRTVTAVVLLRTDPVQLLYPLIQKWPTPSPSGETLLVRQEGEELVYLNEVRHIRGAALAMRLPLSTSGLIAAQGIIRKTGFVEGVDYRGVAAIGAVRPVPGTPWFLVAKLDAEEVDHPVRERAWTIGLLSGLLLLAAGSAIALMGKRRQSDLYRRLYETEMERKALAKHFGWLTRYANDVILLWDGEGRIVEANERALSAYGYPPEELVGMDIHRLLAPAHVGDIDRHRIRAWKSEGVLYESMHRRKDGTLFPVEVSTRVIDAGGGDGSYTQDIVRDITERRKAEEELRASQALLQAVVEGTTDAVYVKDRDGRYILFNKAASHITGKSPGEVIGKDDTFLFPRAEAEVIRAGDRRAMASPVPLTYEETVTTAEGEVRTFLSTKGRVAWGPGEATALFGIARDITALKRVEGKLAVSEVRFRRLFEAAKDGILILDAESGAIVEANPFIIELLESTREEILGKHLWDISSLGDSPAIKSAFAELKETGYIRYENLPLTRNSGDLAEVEFVSNLYEVDGKRVIQCNIRDITARRNTERALAAAREELERKNLELEAFTRTAAHDLRQPITVIKGYVQHLRRSLAPSLDDEHQEIFESLLASVDHLNRFLEDLLVLSRLDAAPAPVKRVPVAPLMAEIARGYQETLAERRGEWRVERGIPDLLLHPTRARELFENLFSNSIKYCRPGVPLLVEVGISPQAPPAPDGYREISFRDNGKGIAPDDQPKVFDIFFRAREETASGTGLGLAIVKRIVERSGGTIRLESTPGEGTTFFFTLPAA